MSAFERIIARLLAIIGMVVLLSFSGFAISAMLALSVKLWSGGCPL